MKIKNGPTFGYVLMRDFLSALAKILMHNPTSYENYHRIYVPDGYPLKCEPKEALRVNVVFQHIQNIFSDDSTAITEIGDSWYKFQIQCRFIGWSVGATLGYTQSAL
ncbi:Pyruvate decarboxylase 1 [Capsicum baccatum]|uniref:Pyruvate decarboxylase 1 n=1 Tax=Capsicum baccatum TaxID=33114 RepID=A0A2G2VYC3_CAPBA|nr:Pyruvate decarboxylase 1 [Capsicum baccatum]